VRSGSIITQETFWTDSAFYGMMPSTIPRWREIMRHVLQPSSVGAWCHRREKHRTEEDGLLEVGGVKALGAPVIDRGRTMPHARTRKRGGNDFTHHPGARGERRCTSHHHYERTSSNGHRCPIWYSRRSQCRAYCQVAGAALRFVRNEPGQRFGYCCRRWTARAGFHKSRGGLPGGILHPCRRRPGIILISGSYLAR